MVFRYQPALQNGTFKQQQKKTLKIQREKFSLPYIITFIDSSQCIKNEYR